MTWWSPEEDRGKDPMVELCQGRYYSHQFEMPWITHVTGNLYQGGAHGVMELPSRFVHVVSMTDYPTWPLIEGHDVAVQVHHMEDEQVKPDRERIVALADEVLACAEEGPTLVHCQMGLNRSGLVLAAALARSGWTVGEAITLLREARSPAVLANVEFERFLREDF